MGWCSSPRSRALALSSTRRKWKSRTYSLRSDVHPPRGFEMRYLSAIALSFGLLVAAQAADITASRQTAASKQARAGEAEFRALYKELVEINTTLSVGSCTEASNAMKARLNAAGYPDDQLHVIVPPDRAKDGNLIAVLPGSDKSLKPILLLAHIDVVEANRADWARDPFK